MKRPAAFLLGVGILVFVYATVWLYVGRDVRRWLGPWYEEIITEGRLGVFAEPFTNYAPPYLYLLSAFSLLDGILAPLSIMKLLSVAGTALLAFTVWRLLEAVGAKRPGLGALVVLLLPSVVINGPMFAQCDALWAACIVLALTAALRGEGVAMLVWCGVALAFKAQAAFLAPFFVGMALRLRVPLYLWVVPLVVYAAMMLPAWIMGWPAIDLATIYFRQIEWGGPTYIGNAPNLWIFGRLYFTEDAPQYFPIGYVAAAAASAAIIYATWCSDASDERLVASALMSAMAIPFLLPRMHERFFFAADILALALAWAWPKRAAVAVFVQIASTLALVGYIARSNEPAQIGAAFMAAAIGVCLLVLMSRKALQLQAA